jgi:hypothetical protein
MFRDTFTHSFQVPTNEAPRQMIAIADPRGSERKSYFLLAELVRAASRVSPIGTATAAADGLRSIPVTGESLPGLIVLLTGSGLFVIARPRYLRLF